MREVASANVTLMGYQSDEVLRQYMQRARAFVFAAEEDFGIAPIEAQACGTPVIAFARGGVLETIRGLEHEKPTGVFYPEQSVDSIVAAVRTFETHCQRISASNCRSNAERFGGERFKQEIKAFVEARIREVSLLDGQLALQGRAAIQPLLSAKHA